MSTNTLKAQVKAAAWGLVALVGVSEAIKILNSVIGEIQDSEWQGPGNR